jgi:flagellar protein FlbD
MIKLTKYSGDEIYLNPHLIEKIEEKADTIIIMNSQVQYIVREKFDEILQKIVEYRKKIFPESQE